jgi:hypothetical protein
MFAISAGAGEPSSLAVGSHFNYGPGQRYFLPINGQNGKFEAADNFNYVFGKHDIKFGGDIDVFEDRKDSFVGWSAGEYDFFDLADFQNGTSAVKNCSTVTFNCLLSQGAALNSLPFTFKGPASTLFPAHQADLGLYLQDKWQLTPSLILTYGLRWDGTWEPQPQTPLVGKMVLLGVGAGSHPGSVPQRVPADFNQWGPRVGVAWTARRGDHPTVVRGAWGLYYAQPIDLFFPTSGAGNITHCIGSCGFPDGGLVGFPYLNPNSIPQGANQLCGLPAYGCPAPAPNGGYVDPKFRNPRVSNLTAGVEQALGYNTTLTVTYAFVHSWFLRTGGYDSEEAWQRNYNLCGTDSFGRSILCGQLDTTLANGTNETASFSRGNYHSIVVNVTKRFSNHFQVFANYIWSQNKDNASSERDTDTYFGASDPRNLAIDYGRNGLDIKHQFKAAGVYDLPYGFAVSSSVIAHTGVPFPLYINVDVNGDGVGNLGHNNDRPTCCAGGRVGLVGRYPFNQPGFAEWDARLQKDLHIKERYHAILSADFFNLTNRSNVYSDPNVTATMDYSGNCVLRSTLPGAPLGVRGSSCTPLSAAQFPKVGVNGFRAINQVAPGSTPFAFQAGVKFVF